MSYVSGCIDSQTAAASVSGGAVFGVLKHEIGVHRVQRVPITEGMGRVHTSTMSVVILPQPTEVSFCINLSDSIIWGTIISLYIELPIIA